MTALKIHHVADWLPLLSEAEYQELRDDIKSRGLREAILVKQGYIIDGRHRYRACCELGIEPQTVQYEGGDIIEEIITRNLFRRHLTADQRAMLVAKLRGDELSKDAESRMKLGVAANPGLKSAQGRTAEKIATEAGVGRDKGRAALNVLKHKRDAVHDVISGKRRLKDVAKKAKPKKQIDKNSEEFVVKRFQRWLDFWSVEDQRKVRQIVNHYTSR